MTKPVLSHLGETKLELGPPAERAGEHWRLGRDEHDVAWLIFDRAEAAANTISEAVLRELDAILDRIETERPAALVIRSAKPAGFAAGADIGEFGQVAGAGDPQALLREGHRVIDRLDGLPFPTIAIVHGYVLGGGFELALACDRRIAIDGVRFAFPEVRLGLHPGLGGTFRLPALIDPLEAMTMMLTGKTVHTAKAKALGIVDVVVEERHVQRAVRDLAGRRQVRRRSLKAAAFDIAAARRLAARTMRSRAAEKAPPAHYPAPHALIDLWEEHGGDRKAMQAAEIASFTRLLAGQTAQNLIRAFFLRERLKGLGDGAHAIRHVHVIGAGTMGAEIAAEIAIKGFTVTLADVALPPLGKAVKAAARLCDEAHLSAIGKRDALDRLTPDPQGRGLARADLIIEAVPEKLDLKTGILRMIEEGCRPQAIIATNTSSLDVETLAASLRGPERFAGLHFFNPVSKLELVEVVGHPATDPAVAGRLRAFTAAIDHLPAPVRNWPGFLVNRGLTPYLLEAALMVGEGVEEAAIDAAAEDFGMPVGPLELADRVGLDICLHVADSLRARLAKPLADVPAWMRARVEKGDLGEKSGRGIYDWKDGRPVRKPPSDKAPEETVDRLVLPMLDACVECLREGVIADADLVDGAMIFATGFAPFRGGPMHYARTRGIGDIVSRLEALAARHGARFEPDQGWSTLG